MRGALLIAAISLLAAPARSHVCIHDNYNSDLSEATVAPPTDGAGARRNSVANAAPIRIKPLYVASNGGSDISTEVSMTPALRTVVETAVSASLARFSQLLSVTPVSGKLFAYRPCTSRWPASGNCASVVTNPTCAGGSDDVTISLVSKLGQQVYYPSSPYVAVTLAAASGESGADTVVYITAKQTSICGSGGSGTIAYATHCQEASNDRPTFGRINICPRMLPTSVTAAGYANLLSTMMHELTHVLAFSSSLFPYFRNDAGEPRTPRDSFGDPADAFYSAAVYNYVASGSTISYANERGMDCSWGSATSWATANIPFGINPSKQPGDCVARLSTPRVKAASRAFFNCPALEGAELENQDTTVGFVQGSHWDARTLAGEYMAAYSSASSKISPLTLAVFEDSGWYTANYASCDPWVSGKDWGYQQGCDFALQKCSPTNTGSPPHFDFGAVDVAGDLCSVDRIAYAYTDTKQFSAALPSQYQYYANPTKGGSLPYYDYCPVLISFSTLCTDATTPTYTMWGSVVGTSSLCHVTTLNFFGPSPSPSTADCYAVACAPDGLSYTLTTKSGASATCTADGVPVIVSGYGGSVVCGNPTAVCGVGDVWASLCAAGYGYDANLATCTACPSGWTAAGGPNAACVPPSPSPTPSLTASMTRTPSPTISTTRTNSITASGTQTRTVTPTSSKTASNSPTQTQSPSATPTVSPSSSTTLSSSASSSRTATSSLTPSPTLTSSSTGTTTATLTSSTTQTASSSITSSYTPTSSMTTTTSRTNSPTMTQTSSKTPSISSSITSSTSATMTTTDTPSLTATRTASLSSTTSNQNAPQTAEFFLGAMPATSVFNGLLTLEAYNTMTTALNTALKYAPDCQTTACTASIQLVKNAATSFVVYKSGSTLFSASTCSPSNCAPPSTCVSNVCTVPALPAGATCSSSSSCASELCSGGRCCASSSLCLSGLCDATGACVAAASVTATPTLSLTPSPFPTLSAGAVCSSSSTCASGACRGGHCCSISSLCSSCDTLGTCTQSCSPSNCVSPSTCISNVCTALYSGPCNAAPGFYCASATTTVICPIGSYCAGGSSGIVSCYPVSACAVSGLAEQPPCDWEYTLLLSGKFSAPFGVVPESPSSILIADSYNNAIKRVNTSTLAISTVIGNGAQSSRDGQGSQATTFEPNSIIFSAATSTYFWSEYAGFKIRKSSTSFAVTTLAGSGYPAYADGFGAAAGFNQLHQLAQLSNGNIVVADSNNHRLRLVTLTGVVTTLVGSGTRARSDGVGISASFDYPNGLAINASDFIFVSEYFGCSIRLVTPGNIVTTISGKFCGYSDSTLSTSSFQPLAFLTLTPFNDIIVADQLGHRFRWLSLSQNSVRTIIGNGIAADSSGFSATSKVNGPLTPFLLTDGTLYVLSSSSLGVARCVPCPPGNDCGANYRKLLSSTTIDLLITVSFIRDSSSLSATRDASLAAYVTSPAYATDVSVSLFLFGSITVRATSTPGASLPQSVFPVGSAIIGLVVAIAAAWLIISVTRQLL